ncbi:MAG: glutathione S-transferase N-terminal domain-containing protein [Deltaproteobacteria bacterium]|nr:glutathione S-transferase N-terminal domain-containing protein [Deltaproteobacteria bacterium]
MRLLGTTTSPYTRKIRILLNAIGRPYEFLDTRSKEGMALLTEVAPLGKIPVLIADDGATTSTTVLADSSLITHCLWGAQPDTLRASGWDLDPLAWDDRALQVVVEGTLDAAINHRYLRQDGFADAGYIAKQRQRVERTLTWLDGRFVFRRQLGAAALSLGCALDWIVFRNVVELSRWPGLMTFREAWIRSGIASGTEPQE